MYFDWITWGIWTMGFIILIVWIWMPLKELKKIIRSRKQEGDKT